MALARRTFLASAMAAAAPFVLRAARGDTPQFALKLQHSFSSVSSAHDRFIAPWARTVEMQSGGRIRIDIFPSMQLGGQPVQLFDQVRDGFVDIVLAAPSLTPGRFPKIEAFELPFVPSRRALVSSKAIQDYAAANLNDEFRDVHPICFSCADRGVIHALRSIATVADIKGMRLHVPTRFAADAVRELGASAVPMPSAQLPVAFTQHVINGCIDPWSAMPSLALDDVLKAHTEFEESSLSTTTFVLAMNKAAYERLPANLRAIIDGNSGQAAASAAGAMWDLQAKAVADAAAQRGDSILTLVPEAVSHWRKATEPVVVSWLKQMRERRIDGGKLLASAHALLEKYVNEPEPQPPPQPAQPPQPKADAGATAKIETPPKTPSAPGANATPASAPSSSSALKPKTAPTPKMSVQMPAPKTVPAKPVAPPSVAAPPVPAAPMPPATASAAPAGPAAKLAPAAAPPSPTPAPPAPPKTLDIPL